MIKEFLKPSTIIEALSLRDKYPDYRYIAGGTGIYSKFSGAQNMPPGVIWTGLLNLSTFQQKNDELTIGSALTLQSLLDNIDKSKFTALYQALQAVNNRNIRNIATIGGNVAWAKPSSDIVPALIVLEASVTFATLSGMEASENTLLIDDYILCRRNCGPNDPSPARGLLTQITIPAKKNRLSCFYKISRSGNDIALANIAISGTKTGDKCHFFIGAGCMGPAPLKLVKTGNLLSDAWPNIPASSEIENCVKEDTNPIDDFRASRWYRLESTSAIIESLSTELFEKLSGRAQ